MKKLLVIFSAFQFAVFTLLLSSAAGCTKGKSAIMPLPIIPPDTASLPSGASYKYLALGDSYTIGAGVKENERFPYLITELLNKQKITVKDLKYIAQSGWTTISLQSAIKSAEPLATFDIVTLLIGVNDQYQQLDTEGYRLRFTELLDKAIQLAGNKKSHVFVLSIPDYGATPFGSSSKERIGEEIDTFNKINKEVTVLSGISYIDITSITRQVATDPTLLADDGLHYSAKEHNLWASEVVPFITRNLK